MIEGKNIDERDIFNYVFFRDLLDEEKLKYLERNEHNIEQIEVYKNMKQKISGPVDHEIKEKLAAKSEVYKISKIISLYPVDDKIEKKPSDVPILAAASAPEEPKVSAQTFIDDEKGYVIRLVRMGESSKVYIFPIHKSNKEKLNITLKPSDHNFEIKDLSVPLEINDLHTFQ